MPLDYQPFAGYVGFGKIGPFQNIYGRFAKSRFVP
jgi:hypothetical protein